MAKEVNVWDPRYPDREPRRIWLPDTVAAAAVAEGNAAYVVPSPSGYIPPAVDGGTPIPITNDRMILISDSRGVNGLGNSNSSAIYDGHFARGGLGWGVAYSKGRYRPDMPRNDNTWQFCLASQTAAQIRDLYLAAAVSDPASMVHIMLGINGVDLAGTQQALLDMVLGFRNAPVPKTVFLGNTTPRGATFGGATAYDIALNAWINGLAGKIDNLEVVDTWNAFLGAYPNARTGAFFDDNIHPSAMLGGQIWGKALGEAVIRRRPIGTFTDVRRPWSAGEVTATPALNANPGMAGAAGTASNTGSGSLTGEVSTGYTLTNSSDLAVLASKGGQDQQVIEWSGTAADTTRSITLEISNTSVGVAVNEYFDISQDVRIAAGSKALSVSVRAISGTGTRTRGYSSYGLNDGVAADEFREVMLSGRARCGLAVATGGLQVSIPAGASSGRVEVFSTAVRRTSASIQV